MREVGLTRFCMEFTPEDFLYGSLAEGRGQWAVGGGRMEGEQRD